MIEVKNAVDCGNDVATAVSRIVVESFYHYLRFFSKDKAKLSRAFAHAFSIEHVYLALVDGNIAGMAFKDHHQV
jgi:hypothetical protein